MPIFCSMRCVGGRAMTPHPAGEREPPTPKSWQLIISGAYANDTPLQPQSERSKRRRQWVGPRENHAGVKVPWCWSPPAVRFMPFLITYKVEFMAERSTGRFLRWNKNRLHSKPYRAVRQAQSRLQTEQTRLAWQTALRDHPELQRKNALSKWYQKHKIKRKYAQAAREAQKTAQQTQNVLTTTGKIVRAVAQTVSAHRTALVFIALLALVIMLFSTGLSSCTAMLSGPPVHLYFCYLSGE